MIIDFVVGIGAIIAAGVNLWGWVNKGDFICLMFAVLLVVMAITCFVRYVVVQALQRYDKLVEDRKKGVRKSENENDLS